MVKLQAGKTSQNFGTFKEDQQKQTELKSNSKANSEVKIRNTSKNSRYGSENPSLNAKMVQYLNSDAAQQVKVFQLTDFKQKPEMRSSSSVSNLQQIYSTNGMQSKLSHQIQTQALGMYGTMRESSVTHTGSRNTVVKSVSPAALKKIQNFNQANE